MSFTPDWVDTLAFRGRFVFTLSDAATAAGTTPSAAKLSIHRAVRDGALFSPARGLWVIVPIEYRAEGVPPWRSFLDPMLRRERRAYYVGLLTAAAEHGASGQAPQEIQVVVNRPRTAIEAGRMRIVFITRHDAAHAPVRETALMAGRIPVSTPAMTALDLVAYPRHAGGWGNVISVLADLIGEITPDDMGAVVDLPPATSDAQRLGFLLERLGASPSVTSSLAVCVAGRSTTFIPLDPASARTGPRDSRWRIIENIQVEPD